MTQLQHQWSPMAQLTPGTSYSFVRPLKLRLFRPGSTSEVFGTLSVSVERHSAPSAGTYYHLQVLSYQLGPNGIVDLDTQRVVEKGIETDLKAARLRAEEAIRRGMSQLRAAALESNAERAEELRAEVLRLKGWQNDGTGHCRHGVYTGGSGIDWMCGLCEQRGRDEEIAELEAYAGQLETAR